MGSKTEHLKSDGMPETRKERCKAYALAIAVTSPKSIDRSLRVLDPFDFPGVMPVYDSIPDEPEDGIDLAVESVAGAVINDLQGFKAKLNICAISPHKRRHET